MANYYTPSQIAEVSIQKGVEKANLNKWSMLILGFMAGAFVALGYIAYIRLTGTLPKEMGSLSTLLGSMIFPIGIILILIGGGELLTGNMMAVGIACVAKKVSFKKLMENWLLILFFNFLGAVFVAFVFGHYLGLVEGDYLYKTVATAYSKIDATFMEALVSAIGCNWLVAMAVWLSYAAKDVTGKIVGMYMPVMVFVLIGFQHVVANMFIIPAAIFAGEATWMDLINNVIPVFIGNGIGGAVFVGMMYFYAYRNDIVVK